MTQPLRVPTAAGPEPALPAASARFLEESRRALEERLADECSGLGRGLGPLGDVLACAVGTEGRGGARWRPLLTLGAAAACRGSRDEALDAAVAVELTHTASLVLDDLPCMDDAEHRRGQLATHRQVGSAGAILLSVSLLARAVELLGRHPRAGGTLCDEWGRTVGLRGMAGGQVMDVSQHGTLRGAKRRLHREKSTALPAFALSAGARVAGAEEDALEAVVTFGRSLGWAYQLLDDAKDAEEDGLQDRPSTGSEPYARSLRIMRRAYRGLREAPIPASAGVDVLIALAGLIVVPEAELSEPSRGARRQRGN